MDIVQLLNGHNMSVQEWPLARAQLAHKAWKAVMAETLEFLELYRIVNYFPLTKQEPIPL